MLSCLYVGYEHVGPPILYVISKFTFWRKSLHVVKIRKFRHRGYCFSGVDATSARKFRNCMFKRGIGIRIVINRFPALNVYKSSLRKTVPESLLHVPPYGLVVRIRRSHRRGPGSIPGVGSLILLVLPKQALSVFLEFFVCPSKLDSL